MSGGKKLSIVRRLQNLPSTASNVTRLLVDIVSNIISNIFEFPLSDLQRSYVNKAPLLHVFKKVFYLVFFYPILVIFHFFANTRVGKTILSPVLPRLGRFSQHKPQKLVNNKTPEQNFSSNLVVGIVTPSFNQGDFIEATIDSVITQSYKNIRYVIQDGASTDNTLNVLQQFRDENIIWESKQDKGQTHALNLGFSKLGDVDIMAYLNSDDILLSGVVEKVVEYFSRFPDVDVIYGNRVIINEHGAGIGEWILPRHDSNVLKYADYVPQETMFWRKSIWEKVGSKFDESYRFAMDWELIVRFLNSEARFFHMQEFLGAFRVHDSQKTLTIINEIGDKEMDRIREQELGYIPSQAECYYRVLPFLLSHAVEDFKLRYITGKISRLYIKVKH